MGVRVFRGALIILLLLFSGCAYKRPYTSSKPYYIVIKSPQMAVAATGFIKKDNTRLNLQLFSAGTVLLDLHVEENVCSRYVCLSRESFNKEFFGVRHYEEFIDELFNLKPIYGEKNLEKLKNGFEQKIVTNSYDITYRVENENLYFKDKKNKILIKLRELK
jgi:hypothetical protein